MQIWIDGDACPKLIKDLIYRAAIRTKTNLTVVANHALSVPSSPFIKREQVHAGFDVVDQHIIDKMIAGDLIITADIPFADVIIKQGGYVINPRGTIYSVDNIKQALAMRNFNESLRSSNMISGGPPKLTDKEVRLFANNFDAFLTKAIREQRNKKTD